MTGGKLFAGQKGFPTPTSTPSEYGCRCLSLPADSEWFSLAMAALYALTFEWAWFQTDGGMTQADAAAAWIGLLDNAYDAATCAAPVETPYWDTASDAGDNATVDDQTWYGTVTDATAPPGDLTFVENVAVWLFTGLLAVGVDPAVAIAFHTVAPGFVVAMRTGDVAEIFRVVLDGHDVARVDTTGHAANDIINVPVIGDTTLDAHDLLVIKVS